MQLALAGDFQSRCEVAARGPPDSLFFPSLTAALRGAGEHMVPHSSQYWFLMVAKWRAHAGIYFIACQGGSVMSVLKEIKFVMASCSWLFLLKRISYYMGSNIQYDWEGWWWWSLKNKDFGGTDCVKAKYSRDKALLSFICMFVTQFCDYKSTVLKTEVLEDGILLSW